MAIFGATTKDQKKPAKTVSKKSEAKKTDNAKLATKDLYDTASSGQQTAKAKESKINRNDRSYRILVKPLVTEKASMLGTENKYLFAVENSANKIEVAKAIEAVYGIKPVKVNISTCKGKKVRIGKIQGKRKDWKKAMVTLPEGKTIQVYEGV